MIENEKMSFEVKSMFISHPYSFNFFIVFQEEELLQTLEEEYKNQEFDQLLIEKVVSIVI